MKVAFGTDHAGIAYRRELAEYAASQGHIVGEFGAMTSEPFDYPDVSDAVVQEILSGRADYGVLICGTGIGVSIRANRYPGIRAALCTSPEMARLSREHNFANVLCLGARILSTDEAQAILSEFLATSQSDEARHAIRVEKLDRNLCGVEETNR